MQTDNQESQANPDSSVDRFAELNRWTSVCSKALSRLFSAELAEQGISLNEFILLWTCRQNPGSHLSQNELAALTGYSSAQLSQTAEQLRHKGWIDSTRSKRDRRRQTLQLAPAGADALERAIVSLREPTRKLVRDSGSWMHTEVVEFLRQMVLSIEQVTRVPQKATEHQSQPARNEAA